MKEPERGGLKGIAGVLLSIFKELNCQFLAQKSVKFKRLGYNRVVITRGVDFHSVVTVPTVDVSELP